MKKRNMSAKETQARRMFETAENLDLEKKLVLRGVLIGMTISHAATEVRK